MPISSDDYQQWPCDPRNFYQYARGARSPSVGFAATKDLTRVSLEAFVHARRITLVEHKHLNDSLKPYVDANDGKTGSVGL